MNLYIWGIVFLVILVIIMIILSIKVEVEVSFRDFNYYAYIIILRVIKINVKDKTKARKKKKDKPKQSKNFFSSDNWENIKYILSKSDMKIAIMMVFGTSSPDVTAVVYGMLQSFLYGFDYFFQSTFKTFYRNYSIRPDMKNKKLEYEVTIRLYTRVIYYLIYKIKSERTDKKLKGGVKDGRASNREFNENHNG